MSLQKKDKGTLSRVLMVMILGVLMSSLSAQFAGGSGTAADPWQVATVTHLNNVRNYLGVNHNNKHFIQTANINLGVPPWNQEEGWAPIGSNETNSFRGSYDGGNYTISGLTIVREEGMQGLFGYAYGATVKNIIITGCNITAGTNTGAIAGYSANETVVENCHTAGNITGLNSVGGLVGYNGNSLIRKSSSSAVVIGTGSQIGGLSGTNYQGGAVFQSYFDGKVSGSSYVGGIVGYNQGIQGEDCGTEVNQCYAGGSVSATGSWIGGITGRQLGSIVRNSYSIANVSGRSSYTGGLIGQQTNESTLINSFAVGFTTSTTASIGGLIAHQSASVTTDSYWDTITTGQTVSAQGTARTTEQMIVRDNFNTWDWEGIWTGAEGGSYPYLRWQEGTTPFNIPPPRNFTVQGGNTIVDLTWQTPVTNLQAIGYNVYRNGVRINDEMIDATAYRDTNLTNWTSYTYSVRAVFAGNNQSLHSIPKTAITYNFAGGTGTENDPFEVATPEHLSGVRHFLNSHLRQINDINLGVPPYNQDEGWVPIGSSAARFTGKYNGNNRTVSNLTINRVVTSQGLFGYTDGATIQNLNIRDGEVTAGESSSLLIGFSRMTNVNNCSVVGTLQGTVNVGMLSGYQNTSHIRNSYSAGNVRATADASHIGGLVGYQTGNSSITDSYSSALVTGTRTHIGGLLGTNWSGSITRCYATGTVSGTNALQMIGGLIGHHQAGTVTGSYWNAQTTGRATSSGGGEGKTTMQMIEQETFVNWDFENLWTIGFNEEATYPYFRRQGEPGHYNYPSLIPPSNFFCYVSAHQQVTLHWSPPVIGQPNDYRIYRGNALVATVGANVLEYEDTGLLLYARYEYYIRARYDDGESPPTNTDAATPVPDGYAGGRGLPDEPYRIRSTTQLEHTRFNPHKHYIQSEDINLEMIGNWTPIGGSAAVDRFTGSFDGNGYRIRNLSINQANGYNQGLFGYVGQGTGGVLKNIQLESVRITARRNLAAIAASMQDGSRIEDCTVNDVEIITTDNSLYVYIGGLVANSANSHIVNSSVTFGSIEAVGGYVGGLVGYITGGTITNSYSTINVEGGSYVGGLVGYHGGTINNCYAKGSVTATAGEVGGLVGGAITGIINNSYSIGRLTVADNAANVGGFVGRMLASSVTNSYWNTQNSGMNQSIGGEGRTTAQMTYPYDEETYVDWDFEEFWRQDLQMNVNEGYPFLYWHPLNLSPNPDIARNPNPEDRTTDLPVTLERVQWTYTESILFTDPVGFRVYMNTTGQFGANAPFIWIPYVNGQSEYSTADVLPEQLNHRTTYYWMVVPTTIHPDGRGEDENRLRRGMTYRGRNDSPLYRGDAQNVPIWRFTTIINHNPTVARDPEPQNEAEGVPLDLEEISWSYVSNASFTNPVGFRVYFNTTGEFGEDHPYLWKNYNAGQVRYATSELLPDHLEYGATYYWRVIPTTDDPDRQRNDNHRLTRGYTERAAGQQMRGDAVNTPIWSFTALEVSQNPTVPVNPDPEHLAEGISVGLEGVSWEYHPHPGYTNPVGFRVYMNTSGQFGSNAPYVWEAYVENQVNYYNTEIIPIELDPNTIYYWRVIPTTNQPETRVLSERSTLSAITRGDAENVPTWRFTTGDTNILDEEKPLLQTKLKGNYPNPFNPETTISFSLAEAGNIVLEIFNSNGQKVTTIVNKPLDTGEHRAVWNGKDSFNRSVGSGIYFINMVVDGQSVETAKMVMIK